MKKVSAFLWLLLAALAANGQTFGHTQLLPLNANTGVFVKFTGSITSPALVIIEDGSANNGVGQGIQYEFNDGHLTPWVTVYTIMPQTEPLIFGYPGTHFTFGTYGKQLVLLRSASALPTIVRITELP